MKLWAPLPDDLVAKVRQMHEGPERGYHGWAHPLDLLEKFRTIEGMAGDALALRCAIVFHDAVYVPAAADNELRSARLAEEMLAGVVPDRSLASAVRLIAATARHAIADETPADERDDMRLFLDLDLSILGADETAFALYETGVRHEYRQIEEEAFNKGRAAILRRFLQRDTLYFTAWGRERLEEKARRNLADSIASLERVP